MERGEGHWCFRMPGLDGNEIRVWYLHENDGWTEWVVTSFRESIPPRGK